MRIEVTLTHCGLRVLSSQEWDLPERDTEVTAQAPLPVVRIKNDGTIDWEERYSPVEFLGAKVRIYGLTTMYELINRIEALEASIEPRRGGSRP